MLKIILLWYKAMAAKAAKKVLAPDFKGIEIKDTLNGYWTRYKLLRKEIKKKPTFGGTLMVHIAEMWNAKLERSNSIAGGAKICDFKWKPNN